MYTYSIYIQTPINILVILVAYKRNCAVYFVNQFMQMFKEDLASFLKHVRNTTYKTMLAPP